MTGMTKICVPITGHYEAEIKFQAEQIRHAESYPEVSVVEFRYDLASEVQEDALEDLLRRLQDCFRERTILFTIRTDIQGGCFHYDPEKYLSINERAIRSGAVGMLDIEGAREGYETGAPSPADEEITRRLTALCREHNVKSVLSYHDFSGTPSMEGILNIFRTLRSQGGDVLKAAFMPKTKEDVLNVMLATRRFRNEDADMHEYISMSMGKLGQLSRVAGALSGADYTFAAISQASAPGQMEAGDAALIMRKIFD